MKFWKKLKTTNVTQVATQACSNCSIRSTHGHDNAKLLVSLELLDAFKEVFQVFRLFCLRIVWAMNVRVPVHESLDGYQCAEPYIKIQDRRNDSYDSKRPRICYHLHRRHSRWVDWDCIPHFGNVLGFVRGQGLGRRWLAHHLQDPCVHL